MGRWIDLARQHGNTPASGDEPESTTEGTPKEKNDRTTERLAAAADAYRRDPGAFCTKHRRYLTFGEMVYGGCSWCEWQARERK